MSSNIQPLKFGLKYHPSRSPCIVLEYEKDGKRRRRIMPVRDLTPTSNAAEVAQSLMKGHPTHLNPSRISKEQITRLVQRLIDKLPKPTTSLSQNNPFYNSNTGSSVVQNQVLNNPFTTDTSSGNALKKDLPTTTQPTPALNKLGSLPTLAPLQTKGNLPGSNTQTILDKPRPKSGFGLGGMLANNNDHNSYDDLLDNDDSYGDDFLEDSEEDLNKLDDDELQKKKAHMDVGFEKNKKRPGDVGYQYDIQDFSGSKQVNEWDEELDDDF